MEISQPDSASAYLDLSSHLHALEAQILGAPGADNALFVRANTGKSVFRFLFDCGADCLNQVPFTDVSRIDAVFFSHLHFDHIAGFDHFLRCNFDRSDKAVQIFGPAGTSEILHHRLQGVMWDRVADSHGKLIITDVDWSGVTSWLFESRDGFRSRKPVEESRFTGTILDHADLHIDAVILDHGCPSIGYCLRMKPTSVVDPSKLKSLQLAPGAWLQSVKNLAVSGETVIRVGDADWPLEGLRRELLAVKPGESIGYITDFRLNADSLNRLAKALEGCSILVCENNYRNCDQLLAEKNFHITSDQVAQIAMAGRVQRVVLFHVSDRYEPPEWEEQLAELRQIYPTAYFPASWRDLIKARPARQSTPSRDG